MTIRAEIDTVYVISEDIVSREIEGELIIVPLVSGIGDMEDELFTMNETGKAIWEKIDGKKSLNNIVKELTAKFEAPEEDIEKDAIGLLEELLKRKMVVEVKP